MQPSSWRRIAMNQLAYYRDNPPRCIAELKPTLAQLTRTQLGLCAGDLLTTFLLRCRCGALALVLEGYHWNNPDCHNDYCFLSPLTLFCASCGARTAMYDSGVHGYDCELGHRDCNAREQGRHGAFPCAACGGDAHEVYASFSYPDDLFDDPDDPWHGRQQEFFDGFFVHVRCQTCGKLREAGSWECA
jgi:hypothetical protein